MSTWPRPIGPGANLAPVKPSTRMAGKRLQSQNEILFGFAERQHGVVARRQLLESGLSATGITRALANGRLHPVWRGVYAVGRPQLTRYGRWMAAVLRCGPGAALSHSCAGALWGMLVAGDELEVVIPIVACRKVRGIVVRRRKGLAADVTRCHGIPVTAPVCTLIDIGTLLGRKRDRGRDQRS